MGEPLRRKACAHPWRERDLAPVRHQCGVALQDVDEFILLAVPVKQRRLSAGMQGGQVYAEVLETEQIAKRAFFALGHSAEEWLRIV